MPQAKIQGVTVQQMIPSGQEVILGAVQDAQFGPLAMFGSGGIEVEGFRDVSFRLAPLSNEDAKEMLDSTWAGRKLYGFRNLPPADREAVLQALLRVAQLAADFPELAEVEINPLRVLPAGQGVFAVDIRLILNRIPLSHGHHRLSTTPSTNAAAWAKPFAIGSLLMDSFTVCAPWPVVRPIHIAGSPRLSGTFASVEPILRFGGIP
jgi:succinyl-CoA synthetase beta subunit